MTEWDICDSIIYLLTCYLLFSLQDSISRSADLLGRRGAGPHASSPVLPSAPPLQASIWPDTETPDSRCVSTGKTKRMWGQKEMKESWAAACLLLDQDTNTDVASLIEPSAPLWTTTTEASSGHFDASRASFLSPLQQLNTWTRFLYFSRRSFETARSLKKIIF